jgi:iron complex transport system substrate-binding protein
VSGGFGFLHDLLDLAGGDNVFGDVKRESMMAATETILARQPDVILELHYSNSASRDTEALERSAWKLLPGVPAVRNGRVHLLYGGELVVPGPRWTHGVLHTLRSTRSNPVMYFLTPRYRLRAATITKIVL